MKSGPDPRALVPWRFTEDTFKRLWLELNLELSDPPDWHAPATLLGRPVEIVPEGGTTVEEAMEAMG